MKIGISGKMTSGKTTASSHLCKKYSFKQIAFADPMKRLENMHANLPRERWEEEIFYLASALTPNPLTAAKLKALFLECFNRHEPTPGEKNRPFLQDIGTEVGRAFDKNLWANYALFRADMFKDVVIDDVRFVNEAKALKARGWTLWRLDIPSELQEERIVRIYGEDMLDRRYHASEIDLDDHIDLFDVIFDATVPLEDFLAGIDLAYQDLKSGVIS